MSHHDMLRVNVLNEHIAWLNEMAEKYGTNVTQIVDWALAVGQFVESTRTTKGLELVIRDNTRLMSTRFSEVQVRNPNPPYRPKREDPPPGLRLIKGGKA